MSDQSYQPMDFSSETALCDRLFKEVEDYRTKINSTLERDEYLCTRAFEVSMQQLFNKESSDGRTVCTTEKDEEKVALLKNIIENDGYDIKIRFAAFVFLFTAYRREDHPDKVRDLVDDSRIYFRRLKIYPQYDLLSIRNKGIYRKEDVPKLIKMCRSVCDDNPDNVGAANAASEIIASLAERYLLDEDEMHSILKEYIKIMSDAIENDPVYGPYSSFYATLGRLYSLDNQYEQGISYLQKAIDMDTLSQRTARTAKWYTYIDNIKQRQHTDQRIDSLFSGVMLKHLNYHNENKLVDAFRAILVEGTSNNSKLSKREYIETREFEVSILQMYDREIKGLDNPTVCSKSEDDYKVVALENVINNEDYEIELRFAFFLFLFTAYRRESHPLQLNDFVNKYRVAFEEIGIFEQYSLLAYSYAGEYDASSVDLYLERCEKIVEKYPKHNGAINAACEIVLSFSEQGLLDDREDRKAIIEHYQKLLLNTLTLRQDTNSSGLYGTLGRLYAQTHDYTRAKQYITKAIDTDRTNQRQTRVMTWRSIINSIDADIALEKNQREMEARVIKLNKEYNDKIEEVQQKHSVQLSTMYRSNIERSTVILVLLSGFISILLGSMNLIVNIPTADYLYCMSGFAGIIMLMVTALIAIIKVDVDNKKTAVLLAICAVVGMALIGLAWAMV